MCPLCLPFFLILRKKPTTPGKADTNASRLIAPSIKTLPQYPCSEDSNNSVRKFHSFQSYHSLASVSLSFRSFILSTHFNTLTLYKDWQASLHSACNYYFVFITLSFYTLTSFMLLLIKTVFGVDSAALHPLIKDCFQKIPGLRLA